MANARNLIGLGMPAALANEVATQLENAVGTTTGLGGTFVMNGVTPVTVTNANIAVGDQVIFTLQTVGGTVGAYPSIKTLTAATGFTVAGTASDTSTYAYRILKA